MVLHMDTDGAWVFFLPNLSPSASLRKKNRCPSKMCFFLLSLFSRMIDHPGMPTAEGGLWHMVHSILKMEQSLETITVCLGWRSVLGCRTFDTKTRRVLYKTSWSPYLFPAFPPSHRCSKASSQNWESLQPMLSKEKSEVRRADLGKDQCLQLPESCRRRKGEIHSKGLP